MLKAFLKLFKRKKKTEFERGMDYAKWILVDGSVDYVRRSTYLKNRLLNAEINNNYSCFEKGINHVLQNNENDKKK